MLVEQLQMACVLEAPNTEKWNKSMAHSGTNRVVKESPADCRKRSLPWIFNFEAF